MSDFKFDSAKDQKEKYAVILGWSGSKHKEIQKYAAIYKKWNYNVAQLEVALNLREDVKRAENVKATCQKIIQNISSHTQSTEPEIIVHSLSNGGLEYHLPLVAELTQSSTPRFRVKANIFDSSPSLDSSPETIAKVVAAQYKTRILSFIVYWWTLIVFTVMRWWSKDDGSEKLKKRFGWERLFEQPFVLIPTLFLYSMEDQITNGKLLKDFIEKVKQKNRSVVSDKCFKGSGHVAHFFSKPREYTETVEQFLSNIPTTTTTVDAQPERTEETSVKANI